MRILAIDPGAKRIGIAISDPTGTIASPLSVLKHVSRHEDATTIVQLATRHVVDRIIVGQSLDENGKPTFEGRRAARLAAAIRAQSKIQVELWDESFSTKDAQTAALVAGISHKKRRKHPHLDELAATVILQSYLDTNASRKHGHSIAKE
ncbi:MAG: Holliday junction resolvase RuvX [Anaerolineales bacterium]|nr:Holliday junction resolvase RuvX [Anaerolineales bacterium]